MKKEVVNGCYYNEDKEYDYDDLEINEYVRTRNGHIGKIKSLGTYSFMIDVNGIEKEIAYGNARKHSQNLIDLIEANDYVNERKVQQVFIDPFTKKKRLLIEGTKVNWQGDMSSIYCEADEIKSIVTHQQFKSIEYTIHEREEKENG